MKIDLSKIIFTVDGQKDGFYPMQICQWLKESNKEVVTWFYGPELSIEPFKVEVCWKVIVPAEKEITFFL